MINKNSVGYKIAKHVGKIVFASESASQRWVSFLGVDPVELSGGQFESAVDSNERYSFAITKTSWTITLKDSDGQYPYKMKDAKAITLVLAQTKLKLNERKNIVYGGTSPRGQKLTVVFTAAKDVTDDKVWYLPKGTTIYEDQHKNWFFDVNLKDNIKSLMPVSHLTKLKVLINTHKALPTPALPKTGLEEVEVPVIRAKRVTKVPVFVAVFKTDREDTKVAVSAATLKALDTIAEIAAASNSNIAASKYSVYKVPQGSRLAALFNPTVIQTTELDNPEVEYMRMKTANLVHSTTYQEPSKDYVHIEAPKFAVCGQNLPKVNAWIVAQVRRGFFTRELRVENASINGKTHQGSCLKIELVTTNLEREKTLHELRGFARRLHEYLHLWLELELKIVSRIHKGFVAMYLEFVELSDKAYASADLLVKRPPVLNSPIYIVKDQPQQTVTIDAVDINKGTVEVLPARRTTVPDRIVGREINGTNPVSRADESARRVVLYSEVTQLTM